MVLLPIENLKAYLNKTVREEWKTDLELDRKQLITIHEKAAAVTPERDAKLQELKRLLVDFELVTWLVVSSGLISSGQSDG